MKMTIYKINLIAIALGAALTGWAADATNAPPKPKWESSASLGATVTRGNSRNVSVSGQLQTGRKWDKNEIALGVDGTYGEDRGVKSAELLHGFAQYNRLFTEKVFGYARVEGMHDAVADIDYRITLSPGAGYYFIKTPETGLRAEVGPGWVYEQRTTGSHDYFTIRFAQRLDQKLSETSKLWETVEFLPAVDNWGDYLMNAEIGIDTAITKALSLRTYAQDSYRSKPAPERQKNDFRLVAAVAYKF